MNKLSERDGCTKLITRAIVAAGWDVQIQVREEVGCCCQPRIEPPCRSWAEPPRFAWHTAAMALGIG
jgi:hypothetical protein